MGQAQIGMVFQQFNLIPHMTALGNVAEAPVTVRPRRWRSCAAGRCWTGWAERQGRRLPAQLDSPALMAPVVEAVDLHQAALSPRQVDRRGRPVEPGRAAPGKLNRTSWAPSSAAAAAWTDLLTGDVRVCGPLPSRLLSPTNNLSG